MSASGLCALSVVWELASCGLQWPSLCVVPVWQKGRVGLAGFWEGSEQSLHKSLALETYQSSLAGGGWCKTDTDPSQCWSWARKRRLLLPGSGTALEPLRA